MQRVRKILAYASHLSSMFLGELIAKLAVPIRSAYIGAPVTGTDDDCLHNVIELL